MKQQLLKITMLAVFWLMSLNISQAQQVENEFLKLDETLTYKIKYGWLKIGEAVLFTDSKYHYIDEEPYYYLKFKLKTVGWLRIFANVNLQFESFVNAKTIRPHHATRSVLSGKKSNIQHDQFAYSDSVYVETYREEKDETRNHAYLLSGPTFTDALSAYMYIRSRTLDLTADEQARLYIANHLYEFSASPDLDFDKKDQKSYELIFPPIKEFPRDKKNYVTLEKNTNIPVEIRLATNNGNFFFQLDK